MIELQYTSKVPELLDIPELHPQPAKNFVPEWYKKTPATNNRNENVLGLQHKLIPIYRTVKTCPSFHDVFSEGYVLVAPCDIHIMTTDNYQNFQWEMASNNPHIRLESHDNLQFLDYYNNKKIKFVFKFVSCWLFKLPKGYSLRQIPYTFAEHEEWTVPYGVIDTDIYTEVNPQIMFTSDSNEILIKAGEPLCYLVPFKRINTKSKLLEGKARDTFLKNHDVNTWKISNSFRSGYRKSQ